MKHNRFGFTITELMITVAIVAILAAIAIPSYQGYIRRSYLAEVNSSFSSIKTAEEAFFQSNSCYVAAQKWPDPIPKGGVANAWDPAPGAWVQSALNVRPDRMVRFQYEVYASNAYSAGCGVAATKPTSIGCVSNVNAIVPPTVFPTNWYVVVARGDLNGDGVSSNIISAIDDSAVIMCNELE